VQTYTGQEIDVIRAVQAVVRSRRYAATDGNLLTAGQSSSNRTCLYRGARQRDQIAEVAAVERQLADALVVDDQTDTGRSCLNKSRISLNLDLLTHLPDFEHWINDRAGIDLQNDSGLHKCAEAAQRRFHLVRTDRQVRKNE